MTNTASSIVADFETTTLRQSYRLHGLDSQTMSEEKRAVRKQLRSARSDGNIQHNFALQQSLPLPKARKAPKSPARPSRLFFGSAKTATMNQTNEPFAFDVWSEAHPPRQTVPEPDVEQMTQAIVSQLHASPGGGLPANYNSHVFRLVNALGEQTQKIEDLERKLEESAFIVEHLRMQLNISHRRSSRKSSAASKSSWEHLRDRFERVDDGTIPMDVHKLQYPLTVTRSRGLSGLEDIDGQHNVASGKIYSGSASSSRSKVFRESHLSLPHTVSDEVVGSSIHTNPKSGEILSAMYNLAGFIVGRDNTTFHKAFYRVFQALHGSQESAGESQSIILSTTPSMPDLSELLEEAYRLECETATPKNEGKGQPPPSDAVVPSEFVDERINGSMYSSTRSNAAESSQSLVSGLVNLANSDGHTRTDDAHTTELCLRPYTAAFNRPSQTSTPTPAWPQKAGPQLSDEGRAKSPTALHIKNDSITSDTSATTMISRSPFNNGSRSPRKDRSPSET